MALSFWDVLSGKEKHADCAAREVERARQEEEARVEAEKFRAAKQKAAEIWQEAERQAAEARARRRLYGLTSIVGQDEPIRRIKTFAALYGQTGSEVSPPDEVASLEPRVPGHVLITGPSGIGRRTLAHAFAVEYCGKVVEADMRNMSRQRDLTGSIVNLGEGDALILSNIERTPRIIEEILVPALRDFKFDFVVDKGMFAKTIQVPLKTFTCIATASSEAQCSREAAEAFHLVMPMDVYSREELALICERLAEQKGVSITPPAIEMVAHTCDGTPHHLKLLVSRFAASGRNTLGEEEVAQFLSVLGLHTNLDDSGGSTSTFDQLSGTDFERLIAELLRRMGFQTSLTKASGDGGVDIVATLERPLIGGRFIIQCKRFAPDNLVGSATVREFYGALTAERGAAKGIFITTSDFTSQAREFAEGLPIELIGGSQLLRMLSDQGLGTSGAENPRTTDLFDEPI